MRVTEVGLADAASDVKVEQDEGTLVGNVRAVKATMAAVRHHHWDTWQATPTVCYAQGQVAINASGKATTSGTRLTATPTRR